MEKPTYKVIAGLDNGNGYEKGKVVCGSTRLNVTLPSVMAAATESTIIPVDCSDETINDLESKIVAQFDTPLFPAPDPTKYYIGDSALDAHTEQVEFNIKSDIAKSQTKLSAVLTLAEIAQGALKEAWKQEGQLPIHVNVDAFVGLALPVKDYLKKRNEYDRTLKSGMHNVTIYNFEHPVTVHIRIKKAAIVAEGQAAHVAITKLGDDFLDAVQKDMRSNLASETPLYTRDDIESIDDIKDDGIDSVLLIDVGEGTVNFILVKNGKFVPQGSTSITQGIGTVMEDVLSIQESTGSAYNNRKALVESILSLQKKVSRKKQEKYAQLMNAVEKTSAPFISNIANTYRDLVKRQQGMLDAVFLSGGGAQFIWKSLLPELKKINAETLNDLPVVFVPSSYSRFLNRNGLYYLAQEQYNQAANQENQ